MTRCKGWLCALAAAGAAVLIGCAPTPVTKYDVAKNQQNKKQYAEAIKTFNDFIADPANKNSTLLPYALYNIAWCYRGLYNKAEAMAAYKKVIDQYPASEPAKWAAADMRELEGMDLKPPTTTTTTVKKTTTTTTAAKATTTTTVKAPTTTTTTLPPSK